MNIITKAPTELAVGDTLHFTEKEFGDAFIWDGCEGMDEPAFSFEVTAILPRSASWAHDVHGFEGIERIQGQATEGSVEMWFYDGDTIPVVVPLDDGDVCTYISDDGDELQYLLGHVSDEDSQRVLGSIGRHVFFKVNTYDEIIAIDETSGDYAATIVKK